MKDDAECKILMGNMASDDVYNHPHPEKANCVNRLAIKKPFFLLKYSYVIFCFLHSMFNEWSFHAFRKFLIIYGALLLVLKCILIR